MISPVVRLNGKVFTRNSVSVRLGGVVRVNAVESVDWSDEVPMELVPAMNEGGPPLGKGAGPYTCEASIGIFLDYAASFEQQVLASDPLSVASGGGNLSAANFQLLVVAREDARVHAVTIVNASIKRRETSVGADGSALVKKYTLQPTIILENGTSLIRLTPAL